MSERTDLCEGVKAERGETRVGLRDGSLVTIRATVPADQRALRDFLGGLCVQTRRLRFFSAAVDLDGMARWAASRDQRSYGLVAYDPAGAMVGHAAFVGLGDGRAEVAAEVADWMHGNGLGTILIEQLAQVAEARGVRVFVAEVLPENTAMLEVFRDGFDATVLVDDGVDTVEFPTASWRLARGRFAAGRQR